MPVVSLIRCGSFFGSGSILSLIIDFAIVLVHGVTLVCSHPCFCYFIVLSEGKSHPYPVVLTGLPSLVLSARVTRRSAIWNCRVSTYEEGLVPQAELLRIIGLLGECFEGYPNRSFYKQLPHRRWLVHDRELVALVAADLRYMRLGDQGLRVTGIIDLCVKDSYRGRGIAGTLIQAVEEFATSARSDAIILFADDQRLYRKFGFIPAPNPVRLLRLSEDRSFDVVSKRYADALMIKSLSSVPWDPEAELDLLGYLY